MGESVQGRRTQITPSNPPPPGSSAGKVWGWILGVAVVVLTILPPLLGLEPLQLGRVFLVVLLAVVFGLTWNFQSRRVSLALRVLCLIAALGVSGWGYLARNDGRTTENTNDPLTTTGLSVGIRAQGGYRLLFPVANSNSVDGRVERVRLLITFPGPPCAEIPPLYLVDINDALTVSPTGAIQSGAASVSSAQPAATGLSVPVSGQLNYGCGMDQFQLSFLPPALTMAPKQMTQLAIDLPSQFRATSMRAPQGMREVFTPYDVPTPQLHDQEDSVTYVAFRMTLFLVGGQTLTSCYVHAPQSAAEKSGLKDCDSKWEYSQVFWEQILDPAMEGYHPDFRRPQE